MTYEAVIGLEVHAQLKTATKIFCGCSTLFGAPPNTHVCPVCLGLPGVLPVLNKKVVEYTLLMALATHCDIPPVSRFARKNYFYPDLPKGYQISQYELPIAEHGYVDIETETTHKRIGITRIHMEEDAGKLIHDTHRPVSQVDFNRTGVPLMEIVSEPDINTPAEAGAYLRQLRSIVRYLNICDGNLEEGSFRCDANISIRPQGDTKLGTRTELKNLNSFKYVEKALEFEIDRHKEILAEGGQVVQETRLWDTARVRTFAMRSKEEAHDYRYFPDPDLLPLEIDADWLAEIEAQLPELPAQKQRRFIEQFQLPAYDAGVLTASRELAEYFEACVAETPNAKALSNWIMGPLLGLLMAQDLSLDQVPIPPAHLARLIQMIDEAAISGKIAKTVFEEMATTGAAPDTIVKEKGLVQVNDETAIESIIDDVLARSPQEVSAFRAGKSKLLGFFVGQVMRATKGQANPKVVNQILLRKLSS
jgi:aspartyl-tRNA(Asn)/glutamyl-tRNA(Gln) amidotransferase subunit B